MSRGKLVTLEGVEGCGKTTQIKLLHEALEMEGRSVLSTAEPGGSALGAQLKRLLKQVDGEEISPLAELLMFLADRAQHVHAVIKPAIESGMLVLCDRYTDSTLAYQGYGRGLDIDQLKRLNCVATAGMDPDLTIVLDCDPLLGLERHIEAGQEGADCRFHQESIDFHRRVREGYRDLVSREPDRLRIIDSSDNISFVQRTLQRVLKEAGI